MFVLLLSSQKSHFPAMGNAMDDMPSLPSQRKESVLGPSSLRVLAMLREFGGEGQAESQGTRGDACGNRNESEQPPAPRCFEGREAVELSILMGYFK
jgi:hypothetical protein